MIRFLKYVVVGASTLALDLALLFVLKEYFLWNYLVAAGTSFVIAVSINYFISRRLVFTGTTRAVASGYALFVLIAGAGLVTVLVLMALFVGVLHWNYLFARLLIAALVGIWNYLMNLHANFKMAG